jgi:hypothetical protein
LNALAYAQGNEIHVGPGQERHLPHEAWHVVQQKQGRVRATRQMIGGVGVNDEAGLESEADGMGAMAIQMKIEPKSVQLKYEGVFNVYRHKSFIPIIQKAETKPNVSDKKSKKMPKKYRSYNSIGKDHFISAVQSTHSGWKRATTERTIIVWEIVKGEMWDFHLSAVLDDTGENVKAFHFTLRNVVGQQKGDEAYAWFNISGYNDKAILGQREDQGTTSYISDQYIRDHLPQELSICKQINQFAKEIFETAVKFCKPKTGNKR